jgi:hypothetical protein
VRLITTAKKKIKSSKATSIFTLNLQAKIAAVLSTSLLLASACTDPSDIGLELSPENNQIGVFYAEIPLSASMILLDSVRTNNQGGDPGTLLAGGDRDPFFGVTEGIGFSRLFLSPVEPKPGADAVLDSAKFQFQILSPVGDSFSQNKTLTVHRLQEPILDTAYYNFDRLQFDAQPFATGSFRLAARRDTIVSTHLEESFANQLFNDLKAGGRNFSDLFAFREYFKGIAIKGNVDENVSIPIRPGANTGIWLYYRNEGDTVSSSYYFNTAASRNFSHVRNDRAGTPLDQIREGNVPYEVGNRVGVKGATGLVVKLDTSPLDQFLDTLGNVTFNQVSLEVGPIENFVESRPPFQEQFMEFWAGNDVFRRHDGRIVRIQAENAPQQEVGPDGSIIPAVGNDAVLQFRSDKDLYSQSFTMYLNAVYRSNLERKDLILFPSGYLRSFRQYVVDQDNIKLKVYYSKTR